MSRQPTAPAYQKSKTLDNKYLLGDEIGKGAYGRVYKGLDLENGDFVAIKQVSLENIAQEDLNIIMQEIDLLKMLNHKNIVKYLGSSKTKTHLHIILEYVENGSLANIIKPNKFGPFPESLVAVYIAQVLEGLVYLHEQGVIHRDIKGANILTTKEGLVKLADFGVATKLTEADVNTHSVVGTPYWMAPEVIEMSGVCAASDIWSVGCTVIELLTCVPPYFDLQPMPALFRIVQDEHPPLPDSLSADMTDFLCQCFKKDARQRPDAKTLLSHPWIQNCRRALQSSLRHGRTIKNIVEDDSVAAEVPGVDHMRSGESSSVGRLVIDDDSAKQLSTEASDRRKPDANNSNSHLLDESIEKPVPSDQVLASSISERSSPPSGPNKISSNEEEGRSELTGDHNIAHPRENEEMMNGYQQSEVDRKLGGKGSSINNGDKSTIFGLKSQVIVSLKARKMSQLMEGNELSRFTDPPGDASLDDLFHPLDKHPGELAAEASTSASTSNVGKAIASMNNPGKNELARELRDTIARKQWEKESEIGQANNGGNLLQLMMGVLKDDVADIDGLIFDEKLPGENLFPLQAVEFSKLVGSLRPEEPEEVIVSACQKLVTIFLQRPEQKIVYITQHGLLPLTDLLDVPKTRVICSVLQLLNQIIKDNTDFQENACLVGLIPVIMSFAAPDRPREIRIQAAYFLQQLCQSSSLTLQMFIACRGIPVLVGFLEADYAKYREMVHLAIDGMWQVFKLQRSTPRNDFCCIAAKNGILLRLINTLYSLNEATRLASASVGSGQNETLLSSVDQQDLPSERYGIIDHQLEPSHASSFHLQKSDASYLVGDMTQFNIAAAEVTLSEKSPILVSRDSSVDQWKTDPSQGDLELRQQRINTTTNRTSTDCPQKLTERASNGLSMSATTQEEQVRPLLGLLEKEPPSRRFSGQLEYVRQLSGLERHESVLPLLHSSDKKPNGELEFLMAEFTDVAQRGRENGNLDSSARMSFKAVPKRLGSLASNYVAVPTSGSVLRTTSGVLNARQGDETSTGLLSHTVSSSNADDAREYLEKVSDLLLEFSQADTIVKSYMCSQSLLGRLFQMFNRVQPPILLKVLKCVNYLSTDANCLENLQRAEVIKYLIPNLELKEGYLVSQIHHEVLNALFNLCKINKRRQEQAAENGIIPHLMHFITSNSPLKRYALPLLCDMAHASRNSSEQLRAHGGLDVYLDLLEDEFWSVTALDSIAVCLAHDNDNRKAEQALQKKDAVQKLIKFFQCCPDQYFVHILEPFLKIITKSARINTTLAVNGLTCLLIARLDHPKAIARLNLLKLIKAVYEHHPQPKKLIVENDLPQKLQSLIEERRDGQSSGGQVLVKQMATSLLKALHINTVL
ncbi:MAP3K epsilon protein kinase 1-like [Neltuma alba]|uniref:MAP3K epsilon protein kinase 1-like n=1 Tax=Neltuma alba TaxID=207710 RepID=UPI0010A36061|nr:MAP3K epsilon protein kinase 1-like [Prosopis alba]